MYSPSFPRQLNNRSIIFSGVKFSKNLCAFPLAVFGSQQHVLRQLQMANKNRPRRPIGNCSVSASRSQRWSVGACCVAPLVSAGRDWRLAPACRPCERRCTLTLLRCEKAAGQSGHRKGRSPVWVRRWRTTCERCAKPRLHRWHRNGRSPVCTRSCSTRLPRCRDAYGQKRHWCRKIPGGNPSPPPRDSRGLCVNAGGPAVSESLALMALVTGTADRASCSSRSVDDRYTGRE